MMARFLPVLLAFTMILAFAAPASAAPQPAPPSPRVWRIDLDCAGSCERAREAFIQTVTRARPQAQLTVIHPAPEVPWVLVIGSGEGLSATSFEGVPLSPSPQAIGEPPTYLISGQVVDADGDPVTYGWVLATELRQMLMEMDAIDATGRFEIGVDQPGDWLVQAVWVNSISDLVWVPVPPGASDVNLTLRLPDRTLRGVVRDSDGVPKQGVTVNAVTRTCPAGAVFTFTGPTNEQGMYSFFIPAAHYAVGVQDAPAPPFRQVDLTAAEMADVDFSLPPTRSMSGTVWADGDGPIPDVEVVSLPVDPCQDIGRWTDTVESGSDGAYSLSLGTIPYTVEARWPSATSYGKAVADVPGGDFDVMEDLTLPALHLVTGRVVTHDGGPLTGDFKVLVFTEDGELVAESQVDANGEFTFNLMSGRYQLKSFISGYPDPTPVWVDVAGPTHDVELRAPEAFTVQGHVYGSGGAPLPGAAVTAAPIEGGEPELAVNGTDATGAYTLTLPAGVYELRALASLPFPSQRITVTANLTGIDFMYPAAYTVAGRLQDGLGHIINAARIHVTIPGLVPENDYTLQKLVYYDGTFSFPLPAGTYRMEARACGYMPLVTEVTVPPEIDDLVLTLSPADQTIRGRVQYLDGTPACGLTILLDDGLLTVETAADLWEHLTPGEYLFNVGAGSDPHEIRPEVEGLYPVPWSRSAAAGDSGVDFLLAQEQRFLPLLSR